jgi:GTP-binding protein Era
MSFKSGFIAIIGRPNVGKSTLLNALLGEKVAIVSEKPQTTRTRIRGVKNLKDTQIVFVDTPGIHRAKGLLNEYMVREAMATLKDVDGVLYMVEATRGIDRLEEFIISSLKRLKAPVILVINKVDVVDKRAVLPLIEEYSRRFPFVEIVPVSALKGDGVDVVMDVLPGMLPEGPRYFPEDMVTDRPERFLVSEIIREKVFMFTKQEVPYSTAVFVEEFKEEGEKNLVTIKAAINVERDSQKGIIIGKQGKMIKTIGSSARADIERLLGVKVYLELFVRVQKEWTKDQRSLKEFGYK